MSTTRDAPVELHFQLREAQAIAARTIEVLEAACRAADTDLVRGALDQCVADVRLVAKRVRNISKFCGVRGTHA